MKLLFKATGTAPTHYEIKDETINGLDLSVIEYGGKFLGNETTEQAGIRDVNRDENEELWVTLKQEVGAGHWTESDWIDSSEYEKDKVYVKKLNKPYAGTAYAKTKQGKIYA